MLEFDYNIKENKVVGIKLLNGKSLVGKCVGETKEEYIIKIIEINRPIKIPKDIIRTILVAVD